MYRLKKFFTQKKAVGKENPLQQGEWQGEEPWDWAIVVCQKRSGGTARFRFSYGGWQTSGGTTL